MTTDPQFIQRVNGPVTGTIRPPGSKSLTNRALIVAALAEGTSRLTGVLDSVDTQVMRDSLLHLGIGVEFDPQSNAMELSGCAGRPTVSTAELWLENSGTSIRFLTALCTLGSGRFRLDGNDRMRERPIGDLVRALEELGVDIRCESENDCPPVVIDTHGLAGGAAHIAGNLSSQYLSALLMAAPAAQATVELIIEGELVSVPYVEMTCRVMEAFGVTVDRSDSQRYHIEPAVYSGREYAIEPDASAASYFFAVAAITGGSVTVEGLSESSLQGDVQFVEALRQMGCRVEYNSDSITVHGGPLAGIDIDMNAISDTAQTLSAVAVFADGSTTIRNVAHMRHKETDRISAVATELRRLGIAVDEFDDGLTIHPATPKPAVIETYDDHRMAMSFALVGLRADGVRIADPDCTSKTYPHFFDDLASLCQPSS